MISQDLPTGSDNSTMDCPGTTAAAQIVVRIQVDIHGAVLAVGVMVIQANGIGKKI